jgi:hypothetical protein
MKLKKEIAISTITNVLSSWWELGARNLDYNYKELIHQIFPNATFGQTHASFIKDACIVWEEKYKTKIDFSFTQLKTKCFKMEK